MLGSLMGRGMRDFLHLDTPDGAPSQLKDKRKATQEDSGWPAPLVVLVAPWMTEATGAVALTRHRRGCP